MLTEATSRRILFWTRPLLVGALLFVAFLVFELRGPIWLVHWREVQAGEALIRKIEEFKLRNHRLPVALSEVGAKSWEMDSSNDYVGERTLSFADNGIVYWKESESTYSIGFSEGFETIYYDPKTRTWR
jgi:hypothetical protein